MSLVEKLRQVMPEESTIDIDRHAENIAQVVINAREVSEALEAAVQTEDDDEG